jgi:hypothetical protein
MKTPGHAAHDEWCADDDWNELNDEEKTAWDAAASAAISAWVASFTGVPG